MKNQTGERTWRGNCGGLASIWAIGTCKRRIGCCVLRLGGESYNLSRFVHLVVNIGHTQVTVHFLTSHLLGNSSEHVRNHAISGVLEIDTINTKTTTFS